MNQLHDETGAVWGELRGARVPRRYQDPAAEYRAAVEAVAVRDRSHRLRIRFAGRQPGAMLQGVLTGRLPAAPDASGGRAEPSAVLTPKGRMVAALRLWREAGDDERYLADVPRAAAAPLLEHLGRYLPPRFATFADVSDETGMLTIMGPRAAELLAGDGMGLVGEANVLEALAEDELHIVRGGEGGHGGEGGEGRESGEGGRGREGAVTVIRTGAVSEPVWDVVADRATLRDLWRRALAGGALPVGSGVWEALRLEAGRPAFGADMDTDTLMPETGLVERLVDQGKGCYTGQEVIVRIRDRGHVNRHLRRLRLSDAPTPAAGTELWAEGNERPVGRITSAAVSPRLGTLALAYVRREVEPGASVAVGSPDGAPAVVEAI